LGPATAALPFRLYMLPVAVRTRLQACGFLLVFRSNDGCKMHRFELGACDRQTYRQTDRSHHRLVPICVLEVGSQNNTYYFKKTARIMRMQLISVWLLCLLMKFRYAVCGPPENTVKTCSARGLFDLQQRGPFWRGAGGVLTGHHTARLA